MFEDQISQARDMIRRLETSQGRVRVSLSERAFQPARLLPKRRQSNPPHAGYG